MPKGIDINVALALLTALLREADALGRAIRAAREQGRDDLSDEEVASFAGRDDAARARLQAKIDSLSAT